MSLDQQCELRNSLPQISINLQSDATKTPNTVLVGTLNTSSCSILLANCADQFTYKVIGWREEICAMCLFKNQSEKIYCYATLNLSTNELCFVSTFNNKMHTSVFASPFCCCWSTAYILDENVTIETLRNAPTFLSVFLDIKGSLRIATL